MALELIVTTSEAGLTVEAFLQRRIPAAPAGYLHQLLKKGKVLGPEGPLSVASVLASGSAVRLPASGRLAELLATVVKPAREVRVLFESRELLAVDKPAGVAVHASVGHEDDNLTARVAALLVARGEKFMVAPVHRLDLETSGAVLFGKGKKACAAYGRLFAEQAVEKTYLALVAGELQGNGELQSSMPAKGKVKEAHTSWRAVAGSSEATLLELQLHSGRQHQIRHQLAEAGHPLFGDRRYGGSLPDSLPRLFLHCRMLALTDPFSGERLQIEVPLPDDLETFRATMLPGEGV